jgi:hypothetical protein
MRLALYRRIAMAIEFASDSPSFLLPSICSCPQEQLDNIARINLNKNREVELFITMLFIYSYCLGAHRQQWMPFRPPFLATGERLVENKMSCRITFISLLFY